MPVDTNKLKSEAVEAINEEIRTESVEHLKTLLRERAKAESIVKSYDVKIDEYLQDLKEKMVIQAVDLEEK